MMCSSRVRLHQAFVPMCRAPLLYGFADVFDHFFCIAKHHHGLIHVKQLIVRKESRVMTALEPAGGPVRTRFASRPNPHTSSSLST